MKNAVNYDEIILIIDDNRSDLVMLQSFLDRKGFLCLLAQNGVAALNILEKSKVSLIIVDMAMPVMNGLEFLEKAKENHTTSHIPVIVLSVYDGHGIMKTVHNKGAAGFVTKPVCLDTLHDLMLENLEIIRSQKRENEKYFHKADKLVNLELIKRTSLYAAEYDRFGNILDIREEFSRLFRFRKEEMIGKNLSDFIPFNKESYVVFWENLCCGNIAGKNAYFEVDNNDLLLSETYIPLKDKDGQTVKILHFAFENKENPISARPSSLQ